MDLSSRYRHRCGILAERPLMSSLQDFMISRVRVKMIELFYSNPEEMYYVREITRAIKEEINAVRRELERMIGNGMLRSEERGNRLYYQLNTRYLYHQELQQMVVKSSGLGSRIRKLRRKLGQVTFVMFSGKFVRGMTASQGEVDLLVVGDVVLPELEDLIKKEEKNSNEKLTMQFFLTKSLSLEKQEEIHF